MNISFIDLKRQYKKIKADVDKSIFNVLDHGHYVMGPEIKQLETKLADYVGVKHVLSCSNGTDAMLIALMAMEIGPGDAVFTTPFTFVATAEVILFLGATPVFVDIDKQTFNIDPQKLEEQIVETKTKNKLKAKGIIAVDLFGLPADYHAIQSIAAKHDLWVLEDAAQSFGASYFEKKAGSFGLIATTSFYPAKPLGGYGDSGAIFTNDDNLYDIMSSIRVHGQGNDKYSNVRIGINGRMDSIQAAVILEKLKVFPEEMEMRQQIAKFYNQELANNAITPYIPPNCTSTWAQYSILIEKRDELEKYLREKGIPTCIFYLKPLHLQEVCDFLGFKEGSFPICEKISKEIISLPMHPYLEKEEALYIVQSIKEYSNK